MQTELDRGAHADAPRRGHGAGGPLRAERGGLRRGGRAGRCEPAGRRFEGRARSGGDRRGRGRRSKRRFARRRLAAKAPARRHAGRRTSYGDRCSRVRRLQAINRRRPRRSSTGRARTLRRGSSAQQDGRTLTRARMLADHRAKIGGVHGDAAGGASGGDCRRRPRPSRQAACASPDASSTAPARARRSVRSDGMARLLERGCTHPDLRRSGATNMSRLACRADTRRGSSGSGCAAERRLTGASPTRSSRGGRWVRPPRSSKRNQSGSSRSRPSSTPPATTSR